MAVHPTLKRAVAETLNKASDYNDNFDLMMEFVDDSINEAKTYVEGYMPSMTGQNDKFLTTNGTEASWVGLPSYTGFISFYTGTNAPSGWLVCNGAAVSRTTYAALFAIIGTAYGAGNGSTTFNLPNLTSKFIYGSSTRGATTSETTTATTSITGSHSHSYIAGQYTTMSTGSASVTHTHNYKKGVNGAGFLPIIKY